MSTADTPTAVRFRTELGLALLVSLVPSAVAVFFTAAFPGFDLVEDDGVSLDQPLLTDLFRQLYSGHLPWWSHHSGCGHPLAARFWMLLYPPHHLAHLIGKLLGMPTSEVLIAYVMHLGFGGFSAFLFLRYFSVQRMTAAMSAIAYGLTGALLGLATNWNDYAFWLPYVPLGFLIIERLNQDDRALFWPCFAGLICSLVYHCSGPVGTIKFMLLVGAYALLRTERAHALFVAKRLAFAGALALLASAGQMLATYSFLSMTTRIPEGGLSVAEGLLHMAMSPEFYRGFFYPLVEFNWPLGFNFALYENGIGRFNGSGVFAGPLAPLALCVAVAYAMRERGVHRALLVLLAGYFLLTLGYFWKGNLLIAHLPFFKHYRWPMRWTPELCAVAALLTGIGIEMAWKRWEQRGAARTAVLVSLGLVLLAITTRTVQHTDYEDAWWLGGPVWAVLTLALVYFFVRGQRSKFDWVALLFTIFAMMAIAPGAQHHRWGVLKHLTEDPLPFGVGSQERVLYLASRIEQRRPGNEGSYAYNLAHQLGSRTVLTYGPFRLQDQEWAGGTNMFGEIINQDLAISAFLQGHLLDTLRVGWVVLPTDNTKLRNAARDNPRLRLEAVTRSQAVYRQEGFREPAFFISELKPEATLRSLSDMGREDLSRVGYIENGYTGAKRFDTSGTIRDFVEEHGTIRFESNAPGQRFVVVTTTWYPGWRVRVDDRDAILHRVNGSFMGVVLPSGSHKVRLEYRPTLIAALFALNLIVLLGLAGYCATWGLRELRRRLY